MISHVIHPAKEKCIYCGQPQDALAKNGCIERELSKHIPRVVPITINMPCVHPSEALERISDLAVECIICGAELYLPKDK